MTVTTPSAPLAVMFVPIKFSWDFFLHRHKLFAVRPATLVARFRQSLTRGRLHGA